MHGPAVDPRQLGHVPAHVLPVRVEVPGLPDRVDYAVWPRIDARAGDPLPVADVAGQVAVDEQVEEVRRASR